MIFFAILAAACLYIVFRAAYFFYFFRIGQEISQKTYIGKTNFGNIREKPYRLLVAGDSIAAGAGASSFEKSFAARLAQEISREKKGLILLNLSTPGKKMEDLVSLKIPKEHQDLSVLAISSNDLIRFTPYDEFERSTQQVFKKFSKASKTVIVTGPGSAYDAEIFPYFLRIVYKKRAQGYERIMLKTAGEFDNVKYISPSKPLAGIIPGENSFARDRLHPNDEGHEFWFNLVKSGL